MKNDEVEKQVEEALPCKERCNPTGDHWASCPASNRPAVLALLERREQEHAAEVVELVKDHDAKLADWYSLWQSALTENSERVSQLIAHRACCGTEHDPAKGKLHGYCVVCGVPWPCKYAGKPPEQPELGPCGRHGHINYFTPHCTICAQERVEFCPRHGKEFWKPMRTVNCMSGDGPEYGCTACAQEKAAPGGVSNVES